MPISLRTTAASLAAAALFAAAPAVLHAQLSAVDGGPLQVSEAIRQAHMAHVSPHIAVLTPESRTATFTLTNRGKIPITATLALQYGYTAWPDVDTALYSPRWKDGRAHDTVIANPEPKDRYAGQWITGFPGSVTLAPNQSQRITLRIDPPAGLPDGEYYARLVTVVAPPSPKKPGKPKDEKAIYRLPITGVGIQTLRDSARIYFRKGHLKMGVRLYAGKAVLDPKRAEGVAAVHNDDLWTMFKYESTGNTEVQGAMEALYILDDGSEIPLTVNPGNVMTLHGSGTMRWFAQSTPLRAGHHKFVVRFKPYQDEFPTQYHLPMEPAELVIPFEVH